MKIALHTPDKTKFPNLALMKLSAWHTSLGDDVVWYDALFFKKYDVVYSSKVFSFTPNEKLFGNVIYGGSGYVSMRLRRRSLSEVSSNGVQIVNGKGVDSICPDYSLYNTDRSYGFLTRGCIRSCKFCMVPSEEGNISPAADIEEFLRHDKAVLMDNNVLACDHGIKQIEKIIKLGIKVDFNQGLDARLIDDSIAKLLSKVKWLKPIRLACDSQSQIKSIQKAVTLLRWHNATPRRYFVYVLIRDPTESLERIKFLKGIDLDCHAQPYIDFYGNNEVTQAQRDIARWVNHKAIFKSSTFDEYKNKSLQSPMKRENKFP